MSTAALEKALKAVPPNVQPMRIYAYGYNDDGWWSDLFARFLQLPTIARVEDPALAEVVLCRGGSMRARLPWSTPVMAPVGSDPPPTLRSLWLGQRPEEVLVHPDDPFCSVVGPRACGNGDSLERLASAAAALAALALARVAGLASEPHYVDHLAPTHLTLAHRFRGPVMAWSRAGQDVRAAAIRSAAWGLPTIYSQAHTPAGAKATLCRALDPGASVLHVCSQRDREAAALLLPKRVVRSEHGAGQTYKTPNMPLGHPSFLAGPGHAGLLAATAPTAAGAQKVEEVHGVPCIAVGSPRVEHLCSLAQPRLGPKTVVAVSVRYPGGERVIPELGSCWPSARDALTKLADRYKLVLHAHPRAWKAFPDLLEWARVLNLPVCPEFLDVLERANVLVVDNSSAALEWLAVRGRGLVLLDAPFYRRWSSHGLRFWDMLAWEGVSHARTAEGLQQAVEAALGHQENAPPYYHDPVGGPRVAAARFLESRLGQEDHVLCRIEKTCAGPHGKLKVHSVRALPRAYVEHLVRGGLASLAPSK